MRYLDASQTRSFLLRFALQRLPDQKIYAALVHFYDDQYRGVPVRMAVLLQPVAGVAGQGMTTIQVAETLELRQTLARHILVKVNELVPEAEALRKTQALKERLDNGADFAELARLNSNDGSASKGGDLGWLFQGDTVPEFESAMDGLKIKEISQPVKTQFGYHLIQVLERRVEDVSQERKRQVARQVLRERKADEEYQEWLRQIRDRAYVEYRFEER